MQMSPTGGPANSLELTVENRGSYQNLNVSLRWGPRVHMYYSLNSLKGYTYIYRGLYRDDCRAFQGGY